MKTKEMKRNLYLILLLTLTLTVPVSCEKYLELKPDASLAVPRTLEDCRLILDNYALNINYPSDGEAAADDYYVTDAVYHNMSILDPKTNYSWDPKAEHSLNWSAPYSIVYSANLVLKLLEALPDNGVEYKRIKGTALFHRAFAFYHLAQLFTKPYDVQTAGTDLGLVLRTDPDVSVRYQRASLKETYDKIVQELRAAADLLPVASTIQTRPNKAAAYAALARVHLTLSNFPEAEKMATEALMIKSELMDFNTLSMITRYNQEVIFQAMTVAITPSQSFLSPSYARIAEDLYASYDSKDTRKTLFFRANPAPNTGTFSFRGSYDGSSNPSLFTGLATDELYLIRAECHARAGNLSAALADLNLLMRHRYEAPFTPFSTTDAGIALDKILSERRKELVFRNLRWTDIRRLNKEPGYAVTLSRPKNTFSYTPLVPGDLRFAMLIPTLQETSLSNIQQNPR